MKNIFPPLLRQFPNYPACSSLIHLVSLLFPFLWDQDRVSQSKGIFRNAQDLAAFSGYTVFSVVGVLVVVVVFFGRPPN